MCEYVSKCTHSAFEIKLNPHQHYQLAKEFTIIPITEQHKQTTSAAQKASKSSTICTIHATVNITYKQRFPIEIEWQFNVF